MAKIKNAAPKKKIRVPPQYVPGTKRARTREKLLNSAAALFKSKGISTVSLDEVAAHAGLSKGAIYGNFQSKNDLVFAVTAERSSRAIPVFADNVPIKEQLRALISRSFEQHSNGRRHFAFLAELDLYALTHEDLAARFIEAARASHEESARNLAILKNKGHLALTPLEFTIVASALLHALIFQHGCYPEIVTEAVALKAFDALAG